MASVLEKTEELAKLINNNSNKKLRGFFLKVLLSLVVFSSYGSANDDKEAKKEALEKEKTLPMGVFIRI